MTGQTLCWVVAIVLFGVGAVMAGVQRNVLMVLALTASALLTLGLLIPLLPYGK